MNMNATAQMVTTTQVGCGRLKQEDAEPIRVGPSWVTCDKCGEEYNTSSIHECERSYPVPPHTMTNRGHLRDIG